MEIKRRKFQGVLNILSFNRHFYVIGCIVLALFVAACLFFHLPAMVLWLIIAAFAYGLIMPLIVSAYVYDFSGFYDFSWLKKLYLKDPREKTIVNINAGFDETSFIIQNIFPRAELKVFDFYNAERHTEPAIIRARKVSMHFPDTRPISSGAIPLNDRSASLIFLLSAVHEIRSLKEKIIFLKEFRRICQADGEVIMVEHLRDFPNFLAFTVGFTHFFSRATWKKAFAKAGFSTFEETKFTPFMSIFKCRP